MAVRVTLVLYGKVTEQVAPQLIPDGLLATTPPPVPIETDLVTVNILGASKRADTFLLEFILVIKQYVPEVESQPDQLTNKELLPTVAVRVRFVPEE